MKIPINAADLSEIRAIVGGKDFPEMVRNVAVLVEATAETERRKEAETYVKNPYKKDNEN